MWDIINHISIYIMQGTRPKKERNREKYSKKIIAENFPNLIENTNYTTRKLNKL